jgi:hypothetical protein
MGGAGDERLGSCDDGRMWLLDHAGLVLIACLPLSACLWWASHRR